jgi:hypothetical protein
MEIDSNLISLMWRQPSRLQGLDWIHVCSKLGLNASSQKAAEKAVRQKVMSVMDRPFLLSPRRLNDKDMEVFLVAIAEHLFDDQTYYTDVDECRAAIAHDAKNDFHIVVDDLKELSLVNLQDTFCGLWWI